MASAVLGIETEVSTRGQRIRSLFGKILLPGALALMSLQTFASSTYKLTAGTGYYDDAENWGNPTAFSATDFNTYGTVNVIATNNNAWGEKTLGMLMLRENTRLDIQSGGKVTVGSSGDNLGAYVGWVNSGTASCVIQQGGTLSGNLHIGGPATAVGSKGAVTNCGTWVIGLASIDNGSYVHQGGSNTFTGNPKQMKVGCSTAAECVGTFEVACGKFVWWARSGALDDGLISVGTASGTGKIVIASGAEFQVGRVSVGKRGSILMRGGTYINAYANDNHEFLLSIGEADGEGGTIRGWGLFTGSDNSRQGVRSADILFRRGAVVADGDGDESHVLECGLGIHTASNALAGVALTTGGWRAESKGALRLPLSALMGNSAAGELTGCIGCTVGLTKPDLVNAVGVSVMRSKEESRNWNIGVELLATDRTDAHTNALPANCNVLSVHRIGAFRNLEAWTSANRVAVSDGLSVSIRYDQTKLLRANTRLKLLRYSESTGRWTVAKALAQGERPDDCVIGATSLSAKNDETFNLGTFAVAECQQTGLFLVVK